MKDEITDMRERLTRVETTVGEDAESGLRGWMAKIDAKLDTNNTAMSSRLGAMERRFFLMMGGAAVALWLLEHVWK